MQKKEKGRKRALAKHLAKKHKHLLFYGIIGASGALIEAAVFFVCVNFGRFSPYAANILGSHLGFANNFILNTFCNFKAKDKLLKRFAHYYLASFGGMVIKAGLLFAFIQLLNLPVYPSQAVAMGLVMVSQYLYNKKVTFKGHKKTGGPSSY